ncbi:MAG: hypothetical protein LC750_18840 [Actinobacteria bacterium]|nr:hypothetical protein [Actinomycetota bacterium]
MTDALGYGTLAASVLLQVLPDVQITSFGVAATADWTWISHAGVLNALNAIASNSNNYDAVLLAFDPASLWDPVKTVNYGGYPGYLDTNGLETLENAILHKSAPTDGPFFGVPLEKDLRDQVYGFPNDKFGFAADKTAIESYAKAVNDYRPVVTAVQSLAAAGVAVIAPSGDFGLHSGGTVAPIYTQSIYGLSSLPEVITVGAAYCPAGVTCGASGTYQLSPSSARGPTLTMGLKPDLLVPSDVVSLVPRSSALGSKWTDANTNVTGPILDWAQRGGSALAATGCPAAADTSNARKCVLQGSSISAAATAAADIASLVTAAKPHLSTARTSLDAKILRGILWSLAGRTHAVAPNVQGMTSGNHNAFAWEEGAGVLTSFDPASLDLSKLPVALEIPCVGEVRWDTQQVTSIPFWTGGLSPLGTTITSSLSGFVGANANGAAQQAAITSGAAQSRISTLAGANALTLTVGSLNSHYDGGLFGGRLSITPALGFGDPTSLATCLVQTLDFKFRVTYGYSRFETYNAGTPLHFDHEGERAERESLAMLLGLPVGLGILGSAFKYVGGDPTNKLVIRHTMTRSDDPEHPRDVGTGVIQGMIPGFYKMHLLGDYSMAAQQARGTTDNLGVGLASSGPDTVYLSGIPLCVDDAARRLGVFRRCVGLSRADGARNISSAQSRHWTRRGRTLGHQGRVYKRRELVRGGDELYLRHSHALYRRRCRFGIRLFDQKCNRCGDVQDRRGYRGRPRQRDRAHR